MLFRPSGQKAKSVSPRMIKMIQATLYFNMKPIEMGHDFEQLVECMTGDCKLYRS